MSSFKPENVKEQQSNMVVLEVSLPSGFTAESDTLKTLLQIKDVKKVETKKSDTVVVIYFDHLKSNEWVCPIIDAYRVYKVAEQKPVSVIIFDYYDSCEYWI